MFLYNDTSHLPAILNTLYDTEIIGNYGACPPKTHFWAYEGEEGDWDQSAWIYQS